MQSTIERKWKMPILYNKPRATKRRTFEAVQLFQRLRWIKLRWASVKGRVNHPVARGKHEPQKEERQSGKAKRETKDLSQVNEEEHLENRNNSLEEAFRIRKEHGKEHNSSEIRELEA